MNPLWKEVCLAAVMGLVLPGVILGIAVRFPAAAETAPRETEQLPAETETQHQSREIMISILAEDSHVVQMELEEYLVGVVLAEMPVSFEPEARKAQAVVARTFTLRSENGSKHPDAAVCTDSACCQAYLAPEAYLQKGGTQEGIDKMRSAVTDTAGQVLTYEGELIEATYFSCSGGSTEDAAAVWGTDVPYLRAVSSPGEEEATHYTDTVTLTRRELSSALSLNLQGDPESWLGTVTYTPGGGVNSMVIGGVEFKGTELRKLLGLRSTAFTMTAGDDSVTVTTRGYGHRVGMSQYGADAMAVTGSSYAEILAHYYQGTVLEYWAD